MKLRSCSIAQLNAIVRNGLSETNLALYDLPFPNTAAEKARVLKFGGLFVEMSQDREFNAGFKNQIILLHSFTALRAIIVVVLLMKRSANSFFKKPLRLALSRNLAKTMASYSPVMS